MSYSHDRIFLPDPIVIDGRNTQTIQFMELINDCKADKAKDIVSAGVSILLKRIRILGEAMRSRRIIVKVTMGC